MSDLCIQNNAFNLLYPDPPKVKNSYTFEEVKQFVDTYVREEFAKNDNYECANNSISTKVLYLKNVFNFFDFNNDECKYIAMCSCILDFQYYYSNCLKFSDTTSDSALSDDELKADKTFQNCIENNKHKGLTEDQLLHYVRLECKLAYHCLKDNKIRWFFHPINQEIIKNNHNLFNDDFLNSDFQNDFSYSEFSDICGQISSLFYHHALKIHIHYATLIRRMRSSIDDNVLADKLDLLIQHDRLQVNTTLDTDIEDNYANIYASLVRLHMSQKCINEGQNDYLF